MAEREPTVIERMAAARWKSMEGLIKPFQSPWNELEEARQKAECSTMLAAVRVLRDYLGVNSDFHAFRSIEEVIAEHERRAGGKGE